MEPNKQATEINPPVRDSLSRRSFITRTTLAGPHLAVGPMAWATSGNQPTDNPQQ